MSPLTKIRQRVVYFLIGFLSLLLMPLSTVNADIYKYRDQNGVIHFTNSRPTAKKKFQVFIKEPRKRKYRTFTTNRYDKIITEAARHHGLLFSLIKSVIKVESSFNPTAVSKKGAKGLMQIMPQNYRSLTITDPFDPYQNIMGGSLYLKRMLKRYNGQLTWALAAYNAGPEAVDRYRGIPPFKETQEYVRRVLRNLLLYQKEGAV
ncbi:MAG: lytic transglycosylase [Deltaproteobacteria bacterium]|nr:MAG: lytic transglycosylase [Deltaproteobacteria bacterium]